MISDTVERCWAMLRAELDGLPDSEAPVLPSTVARQAEQHLREAQELVHDLSNRLRLATIHPTL